MRILGLDLGSKTLGIALSDILEISAQGIETYVFTENNYKLPLLKVKEFVEQNKVGKIVLGYPKNMNGTVGPRGKISEEFATNLRNSLQIDVILWDERMTTKEAEKILINANISRQKRKKIIDKMAAVVILQSYLNSI